MRPIDLPQNNKAAEKKLQCEKYDENQKFVWSEKNETEKYVRNAACELIVLVNRNRLQNNEVV